LFVRTGYKYHLPTLPGKSAILFIADEGGILKLRVIFLFIADEGGILKLRVIFFCAISYTSVFHVEHCYCPPFFSVGVYSSDQFYPGKSNRLSRDFLFCQGEAVTKRLLLSNRKYFRAQHSPPFVSFIIYQNHFN